MAAQKSGLPLGMLFKLAWRNLWRNRRRTLVTLSSIALGFGMAVFFIGIGDGSHNSMIRNAIQQGEGHLTIQGADYLEAPANYIYLADGTSLAERLGQLNIPGRVEPRISLQVLASTANNSVGAALEGVDAAAGDERLTSLAREMVAGDDKLADSKRGILIGDGLANKLKARVNSKVVLMAGKQGGDSQAQLARVKGIFNSGIDELDDYLILSDLAFARLFLEGEGADLASQPVTRYAVFLDDPDDTDAWRDKIAAAVDDTQTRTLDWREMMPQMVQFIALDDAGNYVFLVLILIMVVIGIVNTVLMSVLERTREFGLLRALGLNRMSLLVLVVFETFLLSVLAVAIGWAVGGSVHLWFAEHGIDMSALMGEGTSMAGAYMDSVIYTELSMDRVKQLTLIIFAATMITGIYPAIKAARVTPVEALHT